MSNIINISNSASERIREIIAKGNQDAIGLRIAVKSGGCAGYSYDMDYVCLLYTSPSPRDGT